MLKKLYELGRQILSLKQQVEKNSQEIQQMRKDLNRVIAITQRMAYEIRRTEENNKHEQEKLLLKLENELLKYEKRLSGRGDTD